ncbi:MAG TPA: hypothetical protein VEA81_00195 [Burkholderiaceae bacterium]|nr:hypothetical protein [Burkholderiaceae bacterium]
MTLTFNATARTRKILQACIKIVGLIVFVMSVSSGMDAIAVMYGAPAKQLIHALLGIIVAVSIYGIKIDEVCE